ncbi:MAG: ribonuclease domain-containing protein [Clostridia bacterium]|nr:ribonuclease domain-containing protein [Clostridia bacterium]
MRRMGGRLLALLLALLVAAAGLTWAAAEDWRDLLRDLYGLTEDYAADDSGDQDWETEEQTEVEFELPVTDPQQIVNYLDIYGELPENFITKNEAKALGWDSRYNYVGEVAPGKSIGGDRFGNYEGLLPKKKGRTWYECDANYKGKKRGAERVLFSSDGLYYYTKDHYETFTEMFPEG